MSWIETIPPDEASGDLAEIYSEIGRSRGKVARILQVHSLNPAALKRHHQLYQALLFGRSNLKRAERELLATVVSRENACDYCTAHHAQALLHYSDEEHVEQVVNDFTGADLSRRDLAMLNYAVALTRNPAAVSESDLEHLRDAGFSDRDILDINLITSYFNFVNRVAEGLGVEHDEEEIRGYSY